MIARIWHGWTTPANAPKYEALLLGEVLPDIAKRDMPGYEGAHVLKRTVGDEVEFMTVMWWESEARIRAFTGEDSTKAHVPDKARAVLKRFDDRSQHYEVVKTPEA